MENRMTKDQARGENVVEAKRDIRDLQKEQEVVAGLVSVVIPCYNQAHFLGEAIESVLDQSYPNFEIIVVDDGSPDDTSEVAGSYPEVRLVRQENQGLSGARNAGLARSEGEYVVFLDADDRLLPEALEVHLEHLEAHPECAFVSGPCRRIAADGSPLPTPPRRHVEGDDYLVLLHRCYIWPPAVVMYRRAVFETVGGFNTSLSPAADHEMYLRIARKFPVCSHEKVVAEYRQHGASMQRNPAVMLSAAATARSSQRKYIRGHKQYEESYKAGIRFVQWLYGDRLADEVRAHFRKREWKQALRGTLVLLRYHPWGILLSERRMERRNLVQWVQDRREELKVRERRLKGLEGAQQEPESTLLAEERQEVQQLRNRIQGFERRIQNLSLRARLRTRLRTRIGQNGKSRRLLKRLGRLRAKKSQRLLKRLGRVRIALLSERRMERREQRRRLTRRLQARREELKVRERRLEELEGAQQESESALLTEERQEVQQLRRRIQGFERRIQNLSLRARLRTRLRTRIGQNGKSRRLLERLGRLRAKAPRR
jgi:glycosyltransferase involved in cell wall biosynthesis